MAEGGNIYERAEHIYGGVAPVNIDRVLELMEKAVERGRSKGRPRAFETCREIVDLAKEYLTDCNTRGKTPNVAGLCCYLGITRQTLSVYVRGDYDDEGENFSDTLGQIKLIIEEHKLDAGERGNLNATIVKFDLMNNHGYTDKREVGGNADNPLVVNILGDDANLL